MKYHTCKYRRIIFHHEAYKVINKEILKFTHLLDSIYHSYRKHFRYNFQDYILPISDIDISESVTEDDYTLTKNFGWKHDRVFPYHDPMSRIEFENRQLAIYKKRIETHAFKEEALTIRNKEKKLRYIPELQERAEYLFYSEKKQLIKDYFSGVIRDGESISHVSPAKLKARNIIKEIINEQVFISLDSKKPIFMYLNKDKKRIKKVECKLNTTNEIIILSQNTQAIGKIIKSSITKASKKPKQKGLRDSSDKSIQVKNLLTKDNAKKVLKFIPFLTLLLLPFLMINQNTDSIFPQHFVKGFPFLQVLIFTLFLLVSTWNMILTRSRLLFISISPIILFCLLLTTRNILPLCVSIFVVPLMIVPTYFIFRDQPRVEVVKKRGSHRFRDTINSLDTKYHKNKYSLLWRSLSILLVVFWIFFIYYPQLLFVPTFLVIISTIIFTKNCNFEKRRHLLKSDEKRIIQKGSYTQELSYYNSKNYRSANLIMIFLVLMPLIFTVQSLVRIETPNLQYAKVPQQSRIGGTSVDFSQLKFYSSIDEIDELSINGMFVSKNKISTVLGESASMQVQLIPEDVTPVEGHFIKSRYEVSSKHAKGPLIEYDFMTGVPLNTLDLLPGTYQIREYYSILTGFAYRNARPVVSEITLVKDNLKAVPSIDFDLGVEYGAVYTIKRPDCWEIIYSGTIVNSLRKPTPDKNLTLYF